MVLGYHVGSKW